jgi:uncharacterized Zn finger protein
VLFIFGLTGSDRVVATQVFPCDYCGNNAAHRLVRRTRKITVFFIPLIPVGTKYLDSCTACGRLRDVPKEQAEAAVLQSGR